MKPCYCLVCLISLLASTLIANGQTVNYPYPVRKINIAMEDTTAAMAYMDIASTTKSKGITVVLFHGKNFNGYYWKDIIPFLINNGYRVVVPDQIGWGRSDKPHIHYSFHSLAANTAALLDSLGIEEIFLIGHSMGGMLATRFTLMYPERVKKIILENPIGLEDYRRFVPYKSTASLAEKERTATYETYKKYQQSYYPVWKPEYEQYVAAQAEALSDPSFHKIAKVNALTYQMIYEQPVCYEWDRISVPVLLILGQEDRTVVGKDQLTDAQKKIYGQYPELGRKTNQQIRNAQLAALKGIGHIPHIQDPGVFQKHVLDFFSVN